MIDSGIHVFSREQQSVDVLPMAAQRREAPRAREGWLDLPAYDEVFVLRSDRLTHIAAEVVLCTRHGSAPSTLSLWVTWRWSGTEAANGVIEPSETTVTLNGVTSKVAAANSDTISSTAAGLRAPDVPFPSRRVCRRAARRCRRAVEMAVNTP